MHVVLKFFVKLSNCDQNIDKYYVYDHYYNTHLFNPTLINIIHFADWWSKFTRHCMLSISVYLHLSDVIMSAMATQITDASIVYSAVCSGEDQRKHESSASLAFVKGIHRWISRTNGQSGGKCFHLMTTSWWDPMIIGPTMLIYQNQNLTKILRQNIRRPIDTLFTIKILIQHSHSR